MGLIATVFQAVRGEVIEESTNGEQSAAPRTARCRNCAKYYAAERESCPHCGSHNKLLGGAPGSTDAPRHA